MEAVIFAKLYKADAYENLGVKKLEVLPRADEFLRLNLNKELNYFQVIAILHKMETKVQIEIYCVQAEPNWEIRKTGNIGFSR